MCFRDKSRNVRLALFYSFTISISETSWGYAALSGYLSEVGHSNFKVGLAEGLQGVAQLLFALVAGEIADKVNRRKPLRIGILVGIIAIACLWFAMYAPYATEDDSHGYWLAAFGLFMWGAFRGVTLAPLDALYADSVKTSDRSKYQVHKFVATLAGATCGPLSAVVLFKSFGDNWTKNELRTVIAVGTAFAIIPLLSLFGFHDRDSLDEETSGTLHQTSSHATTTTTTTSSSSVASSTMENVDVDKLSAKIRLLCFITDAIGGVASGMTIKFFPLFFRDKTNLTPGEVNSVTIITTILMIFGSILAQKLSKKLTRIWVIVAFKLSGIVLLFIMAMAKSTWSDWKLIVPIYIVRTVLMNSTQPLHKSILMDHCPKGKRARWSAADSLVTFGWSGSAMIGGILADNYGFGFSFLVTAILQFVGLLVLIMLTPLVKDHSEKENNLNGNHSITDTPNVIGTDSLEEVVTEEYRLIEDDEA